MRSSGLPQGSSAALAPAALNWKAWRRVSCIQRSARTKKTALISFGRSVTAQSLDGSAAIRPRATFPSTECVPQTSGVLQSPTTFSGRRCSWPVHPSPCLHGTRRYALCCTAARSYDVAGLSVMSYLTEGGSAHRSLGVDGHLARARLGLVWQTVPAGGHTLGVPSGFGTTSLIYRRR